jgi:AmiR/NasT family two-component response regulator
LILLAQEFAVERTRVIIADDESLIRMDLREMLTNLGYLVVGERAMDAALSIWRARCAPILWLWMSKCRTWTASKRRGFSQKSALRRCLLLSAYSQQELVQRARQAGVAGYLVKPFRESDLTPAIEVVLARFSEFRSMEREVSNLHRCTGDAQDG